VLARRRACSPCRAAAAAGWTAWPHPTAPVCRSQEG
jgi:hypothetical protein